MRSVFSAFAGLVVLAASGIASADEVSSEPFDTPWGEMTCGDLKEMFAKAEEEAASYQPPPQPPECEAVCLASRLAACAVSPRACSGEGIIVLSGGEDMCGCSEFATPQGDGSK